MRRKAKIAATLGPACDRSVTLTQIVDAGLDIARLNFSHGDMPDHHKRVGRLRRIARSRGRRIALMADLQGPRFRIGRLAGGRVDLVAGSQVELLCGRRTTTTDALPVSYAAMARDVKKRDRVLIDDGKVELQVRRVRGHSVFCEVVRGGPVTDNKGINLPGTALSAPALTPKDRRDLKGAVEMGADWLAVSFVRRPEDIRTARRLLKRAGRELPVMAKIERPEAIDRLEEILAEADGLLVARGDLGVELPAEDVPILQKQIIDAAVRVGKPVMTATQMLESMRYSRRPTRAEASDVANAVLDGSGSLLLTAETAAGEYPVEAVAMMARIIEQAEASGHVRRPPFPEGQLGVALSTCVAGCRTAYEVGARCIAVFTRSGFSARQAARFRPRTPIVAFAQDEIVARQLQMIWGVDPRVSPRYRTVEQMIDSLNRVIVQERVVRKGELVVVLAGTPIGVPGTTNLLKVHKVGTPAASR